MQLTAVSALAFVVITSGLASAQTAPAPAPSAANFDGEWSGSGGIRLVLKADPAGLTGTVMEPAGAGPITIERGSVNGRTATFVTSRSVNGEPVTVTWTAELNDDDTLAVSRLMDSSAGREGRGAAAGRGRGERGGGAGAGRGAGRVGRGRAGGGAPPEAGGGEQGRAGGGERGRAGGGERGRAGGGERGRAAGGRRGGGPAARGAGDFGGGFPEILRRVP